MVSRAAPSPPRACEFCGASLEHMRSDARYCGVTHRVEAWRVRRLLQGVPTAGYATLADRMAAFGRPRRARRNTKAEKERKIAGDQSKRPGSVGAPRARQQEGKS